MMDMAYSYDYAMASYTNTIIKETALPEYPVNMTISGLTPFISQRRALMFAQLKKAGYSIARNSD